MGEVWRRQVAGAEQAVLLVLADYADDDGGNCYPSHARIAWKTGLSERGVRGVIARLRAWPTPEAPVVEVERQGGGRTVGGGGIANRYRLHVTRIPAKAPFATDTRRAVPGTPADTRNTVPGSLDAGTRHNGALTRLHGADNSPREQPPKDLKHSELPTVVPPRTEVVVEVVRQDAGTVVGAYVDAHRDAYDGVGPLDTGRMAAEAKRALGAGWPYEEVLTSAQACARDPYGASALDKHLRAARGATAAANGNHVEAAARAFLRDHQR